MSMMLSPYLHDVRRCAPSAVAVSRDNSPSFIVLISSLLHLFAVYVVGAYAAGENLAARATSFAGDEFRWKGVVANLSPA